MPRCDLENHAKSCTAMYRIASQRPDHPCKGCLTGKKRTEGETITPPPATIPPQPAVEKPAEIIPKDIPDRIPVQGKEGSVDQEKVKENIVRVLGRKGSMNISSLKLFAGNKESKEDFRAAIDALTNEGKVVTKQGAQAGSLHVALPGAPAPAEKAPRKKVARTTREPVVRNRKTAAPSNGSGTYAAMIQELEAQRTAALDKVERIDGVIETLRELA